MNNDFDYEMDALEHYSDTIETKNKSKKRTFHQKISIGFKISVVLLIIEFFVIDFALSSGFPPVLVVIILVLTIMSFSGFGTISLLLSGDNGSHQLKQILNGFTNFF